MKETESSFETSVNLIKFPRRHLLRKRNINEKAR